MVRSNAHDTFVELVRDDSRAEPQEGQSHTPTPEEWEAHMEVVAARATVSADTDEPADAEEGAMAPLNDFHFGFPFLLGGLAAAVLVIVVAIMAPSLAGVTAVATVLAVAAGLLITWLKKKGCFDGPGRRASDVVVR